MNYIRGKTFKSQTITEVLTRPVQDSPLTRPTRNSDQTDPKTA